MRSSAAFPKLHPVAFQLSPGEIHFLWWFIQGSIMFPSTRDQLRRAWGMCERHAWGFISIDAAFRGGYLHGPAVLYEDLMGRAFTAMDVNALMSPGRMLRKLREKEPCIMCEGRYGPDTKGAVNADRVQKGRDLT